MAMPRPAVVDDVAAIIALLRGDNPAGLWSPRHITAAITAPHEFIRVDDSGPYICRVSVNHELPEVVIPWLLPAVAQAALLSVFKAAMIAAADTEVESLAFPVRGDFYLPTKIAASTKAGAYKQLFSGATVVTLQQPDGRWIGRISMSTFGAAVAVVRRWL